MKAEEPENKKANILKGTEKTNTGNVWKVIAEMVGVNLYEEFEIGEYPALNFQILPMNLLHKKYNETCDKYIPVADWLIKKMIKGELTIIRRPYKPKYEEDYWSLNEDGDVEQYTWCGDLNDLLKLKCKMIYRSKEEANESRESKIKELLEE